jgi:hypothetical protein
MPVFLQIETTRQPGIYPDENAAQYKNDVLKMVHTTV